MKNQTLMSFNGKTKMLIISGLFSLLFIVSSCTNQEEERRRKELNEMDTYVKDHVNAAEKYRENKWEDMQREFDEKKAKLDKDMDKMNKEMKESYERNVAEWEAYKLNYLAMRERKLEEDKLKDFKASLLAEGMDYELQSVNSGNIANVYEYFVNRVDNNKELYTKEEWTVVNDFWKRLNDKKDLLENDISKGDGKKIAGLKVK